MALWAVSNGWTIRIPNDTSTKTVIRHKNFTFYYMLLEKNGNDFYIRNYYYYSLFKYGGMYIKRSFLFTLLYKLKTEVAEYKLNINHKEKLVAVTDIKCNYLV